ncbi:hypothetical protein G5C60_42695 [Streptomyces sp. HC44]|uniref:Uncharacterized protein n=1 Tax=Streptomyces scabichelini TaxID=2711217 RepID=A0A6G4VJ38_9ACTN|nr:hypothetical protein [Streptomyces scabichelini]NGO14129.1 hypothetical protein [Streptomyces scabichelini]
MRLWTASLLLRLPLGELSRPGSWALATVLRAADSGEPAALHALEQAIRSKGHEAVWSAWLRPSASGTTPPRWASPVPAALGADVSTIPGWVVNLAWKTWLDEAGPDPGSDLDAHAHAHADAHAALWSLLEQWDLPAKAGAGYSTRVLSRLALGDGEVDDEVSVDPRLLVDTAVRFDHPVGESARTHLLALGDAETVDLYCAAAMDSRDATAFCVAHHLAPADEVRRAVFFVRTGQHEQYRALDPEGALLALGYRSASAEERSALREAMTGLGGGIDALRVLAGQRSLHEDVASLDGQERAYLIRQLKDQGDWDRLWRFTSLLPLAEAVRTVRAFGTWRPSGEDDHRVFEALRAADPQAVDGCVNALPGATEYSPVPHTRIRLADLDKRVSRVMDFDFAPDGTQLAFVGAVPSGQWGKPIAWAGIVDLGSSTLSRLNCNFTDPLDRVAHLGSDTMVVAETRPRHVDRHSSRTAKIHYVDRRGVLRTLDPGADEIHGLERIAGDRAFALSAVVGDVGDHERPVLFIGGPGGALVDSGVLDELDEDFEPLIAAVDPDGRLVAIVDVLEDAVVADLGSSVANKLDDGSITLENVPTPPAALSPSTLVSCTEAGDLKVWHEPLTSTEPSMTIPAWSGATRPAFLAWSPALNRFVAVNFSLGSHLELLDVPPTRDAPVPDELISERVALVGDVSVVPIARLSPKGDVLAVGGADSAIDLYDLTALTLRPLIARPMGLMTHQELAHVVKVQEHPLLDAGSRTTLTLLRACLEHRFRHDVGIGDTAGTAVAGDFEIELGEV